MVVEAKFDIERDLFPYQMEDSQRVLDAEQNFLDLSEMGTGKTPKALRVVKNCWDYGKVLIVCPKTLQLEWYNQIAEWLGIEVSLARQNSYTKLKELFKGDLSGVFDPIFITNYETFRVRRHLEVLSKYPFSLVVADEAHNLRNPQTQMFKGIHAFMSAKKEKTPILPLTGSPFVNNPADLQPLLVLSHPNEYAIRDRPQFIRRYCIMAAQQVMTKGGYPRRVWKMVGTRNMEELAHRTAPFTIRRTKKEVLPYLPDKYYRKVELDMPPDQYEAYKSMERQLMVELADGQSLSAPGTLATLIRLRQLNLDPRIIGVDAGSSKTDFFLDTLDSMGIDKVSNGQKLVVFSTFREYIFRLERLLRERDIKFRSIHGGKSQDERNEAQFTFQNNPEVPIILGTIATMGVGLTLTASSNVFMADRWWNPMLNEQAIDRTHRISQKNAVQVIIPVNNHSMDASLDRILAKKSLMSSVYFQEQDTVRAVLEDLQRMEMYPAKVGA